MTNKDTNMAFPLNELNNLDADRRSDSGWTLPAYEEQQPFLGDPTKPSPLRLETRLEDQREPPMCARRRVTRHVAAGLANVLPYIAKAVLLMLTLGVGATAVFVFSNCLVWVWGKIGLLPS